MHNILCHNCPHPVSAAAAWWAQHHQNHQNFPHNHETSQHIVELEHHHLQHQQNPNFSHQVEILGAQLVGRGTSTSPHDQSHANKTSNPPTPGNSNNFSRMMSSPLQYVTITDRDTDVGAEGVNSNSSYVTYADGSNDHGNLYASAALNGQSMSYPVYSSGDTTGMCHNINSDSSQYYSHGSPAYTQEGGAYITHPSGNNNNNVNGVAIVTHNSRASSAVVSDTVLPKVQWLMENYEIAEGVSLPRYTMYYNYLRHCASHKLDPVNAASFGKLIRSVFLGLRTRRLGTRGNSKYHYYGIRLKPDSNLNQLYDDGVTINGPNGYYTVNGRGPLAMGGSNPGNGSLANSRGHLHPNNNNHLGKRMKVSKGEGFEGSSSLQVHDPAFAAQFLGDHSRVMDDFPELDENIDLPDGILSNDIIMFSSLYKEHCESLLDALANFQMANVESYWRNFWRAGGTNIISGASMEPQNYENLLPKQKLVLLCGLKKVQDFIRDADFQFYQNIVGFLLPDVLRPIPGSMAQVIRNFSKSLEGWLASAMADFSPEIVVLKVSAVSSLAQTLRRYTSLNHLAQAARAVLLNRNQINQMLTDLNRVDFSNIEEQALWVCGCQSDIFPILEQDFKRILSQHQTLEQWAAWLESVVDRVLHSHITSSKFAYIARQFLLKWSFYNSLIIRDLTLRSAASFGSFHLLRLFYDEYMFYVVENRVAQVTGVLPITVVGKPEPQVKVKIEADVLDDPSTADIMEIFGHTANPNDHGDNSITSSAHHPPVMHNNMNRSNCSTVV